MARRTKAPESLIALTEDPMPPALSQVEISTLERLADASPEEFQRQAARMFRRLAIEGFREIRAPRNYRELQTAVDLWRKLDGLDKGEKGQVPVGLVGVLRSVNRRVVDIEPVESGDREPGFE